MGKWIFEKVKTYLECFLDIVYPRPGRCNGCGVELKEFHPYRLCQRCICKISIYKENDTILHYSDLKNIAFDACMISCNYEELVREMIHRIKYKDKREVAVTIAAIMSDKIKNESSKYDYIISVPISKRKLKKRGYNHIELIALELKEQVRIPISKGLIRVKDTKPQVLFNGHERWYNVKGCFKCNEDLSGKRILLIDDLITTGATAHFCAEELKIAGASHVTIFSFAKSNLL